MLGIALGLEALTAIADEAKTPRSGPTLEPTDAGKNCQALRQEMPSKRLGENRVRALRHRHLRLQHSQAKVELPRLRAEMRRFRRSQPPEARGACGLVLAVESANEKTMTTLPRVTSGWRLASFPRL